MGVVEGGGGLHKTLRAHPSTEEWRDYGRIGGDSVCVVGDEWMVNPAYRDGHPCMEMRTGENQK
jgi:hypothetical protein